MRPVRLDITGFACFREPAVVDFTDADYFALVGPTGSGKSTVIDAMTFALYGSAPRWGKVNAIADALAPTASRCTVRLVFDLGPARYVVAREVRRSGKSVLQKNVVLERLLDPTGTGIAGEDSEVIAGDLKEVNRSIEKLLGLSFSDFCQCIVLPQGQFAEFLKATPKDRQEILLKLLGAGHYEAIAKSATARAALAAERATIRSTQLGDLAGATEEAQTAARDREIELSALTTAVEKALPAITDATALIDAATAEYARLSDEQARLSAERMPPGITDLQAGLDEAERQRVASLEREVAAVEADTAARTALAAGPSRPSLELAIGRHEEQARLAARRASVAAADRSAAQRQADARSGMDLAEAGVSRARDARDRARQAQLEATAAHEALRQRRRQLAAVRTPDGIDVLGARTVAAREGRISAGNARVAAEAADQLARELLRQAPGRGPLEQALKDLAQEQATHERLARLALDHEAARIALARAAGGVDQARQALETARGAYERAADARTAATLRLHLVSGHACPVCEQTVTTLPPPPQDAGLETAKLDVTRAETELNRAQHRFSDAARAEAARSAEIASSAEHLERLADALDGHPRDAGAVAGQLARLDGLVRTAEDAAGRLAAARDDERAADAALAELGQQSTEARTALLAAHGPLISSGAPPLDDSDLPAAWATLTAWTTGQIGELDGRLLPQIEATRTATDAVLADAARALSQAESELRAARTEHADSMQAAARSAQDHRTLTDRLAELDTELAPAPTAEQAADQLRLCTRLEVAARLREAELIETRAARVAADEHHQRWNTRAAQARKELRAARDRLVPLGAPEMDDTNVAVAWSRLLSWAAEQARSRREQAPAVAERIQQATRDREAELRAVRAQAAEHAVPLEAGESPAVLPARMATALERARAEIRLITEKRSKAASLTQELAQAREEQQVAKLLADLLRFDRFPRWLASAALDTLVTDASTALSDLSGGQFDLSHDRGEFVVIDHADADSRRSVRTLSGGETFQASLALALALSAQLSTLAAEGAVRLDSIFLDEGFGTLDPETLEVVAGTLENLAHGARMVGVITHVAALADRAPVRFAVQRDHRTSTIVREGG